MPEPKITARLVLLESAGEDDGLNKQERKALDVEEFKSNKMLASKRFIQTALGTVVNFVSKLIGWYVGIRTFIKKLPGNLLKKIPVLGEWLSTGAQKLKVGFGNILQFVGTINPNLLIDWMNKLGISTSVITGLQDETTGSTSSMKGLRASYTEFTDKFNLDSGQTTELVDSFNDGVSSFSSALQSQPIVDALGNLEVAVGDIDAKLAELKLLRDEIAEMQNNDTGGGGGDVVTSFPTKTEKKGVVGSATKKIVKAINRLNNKTSSNTPSYAL